MYTHADDSGMLWRFEGGRPISKLADEVMESVAKDMARQKNKVAKSTAPNTRSRKAGKRSKRRTAIRHA